jgi:hypothetical protein
MVRPESCVRLAGGSPVRVSAEAPGSRPWVGGEIPLPEQGVKSLERREQDRGPQHEVKLAASSDYQPKGAWEGRAGHVAAKATDSGLESERPLDLPGVGSAGRDESQARNRRDPTRWPTLGEGGPYKPSAKGGRAGRESEGLVVPLKAGSKNRWREGALLRSGLTRGKCWGMVERPNNPHEKARESGGQTMGAGQVGRMVQQLHEVKRGGDVPRDVQGVPSLCSTQAWSGRPSVSRVRQNRMHGLNGGLRSTGAQAHRA